MHDLYIDNHQVICAVSTRQDKQKVMIMQKEMFAYAMLVS